MSDSAILVKDLYKKYDLGTINSGTFSDDVKKWWARYKGKEDPFLKIGENGHSKETEHWALKGIDFEIKKGESVAVIGKNGAGKSTLLKLLSRITTPTKGEININGRIASLLEVGTGFHPDLTGRENIFMNGAILGMTRHEISRKLDEIIGFSGVEKYIDTPVKRYSSGMYVRLAFAVSAHLEPDILIIDEVLAVGDAEFQKKCLGKMGEVAKDGRTVLFVSHNMGAVAELCEKSIVLHNGSLAYYGNVSEAITMYSGLNLGDSTMSYKYVADPSSTGKKDYYIESVEIQDKGGHGKGTFLFDESMYVETVVKSNVEAVNVTLSIALLNKNLNKVFTLHKDLGSYSNETKIKLKLPSSFFAPNYYSFSIAVIIHNRILFDLTDNICPIQIVDNGSDNALLEGLDYGSVIIKPEWIV